MQDRASAAEAAVSLTVGFVVLASVRGCRRRSVVLMTDNTFRVSYDLHTAPGAVVILVKASVVCQLLQGVESWLCHETT